MKIYLAALLVLVLVLVGQLFSLEGYIRWFGWGNILLHIVGGLGIGLFVCGLVKSFGQSWNNKKTIVVMATLGVGIVWELFEGYFGIAGARFGTQAYYFDTTKDLIDDIIGGAIAAFLVCRK